MGKLTQRDDQGNWCLKGVKWEQLRAGSVITKDVAEKLYGALCKLRDYENTDLSPEEVERVNDFSKSQAYLLMEKLQKEREKHQWIPVTEQLPERNESVLLCMKSRSLRTGMCIQTGSYDNGFWFVQSAAGYESLATFEFYVLAWMPLPEPYREETEDEETD